LQGRVLIFEDVSHEDVLATMKEAELFVLPSRIEPFGIVLLEAATFGLPVIATNTGGIPEIIEHDKSGVLVMQEDEKGLSSAMFELLNDRKRASALAGRLNERVSSKFTLVHVAKEYEIMAGVTQTS